MKNAYLMFFLTLQLFIMFPHIGGENVELVGDEERIINGETAQPNQFPWMAGVFRAEIKIDKYPIEYDTKKNFQHYCGGSILAEKVVLTAAHCVYYYIPQTRIALVQYPASALRVSFGENDLNSVTAGIDVARVVVYPQYNTSTYRHDVAVLILKNKINLKLDGVRAIGMSKTVIGVGISVTVAGWGDTCHTSIDRFHLRYALMKTIPTNRCYDLTNNVDPNSTICTGPDTHIGAGDSGGGLWLTKDQTKSLIGIVSTGHGCKYNDQPQSFVRLSTYRTWVENIMKKA